MSGYLVKFYEGADIPDPDKIDLNLGVESYEGEKMDWSDFGREAIRYAVNFTRGFVLLVFGSEDNVIAISNWCYRRFCVQC